MNTNLELRLEHELEKFWLWSKKSPKEYSVNRGLGEWETDYPYWAELNSSIDITIELLNEKFDNNLADRLVVALAIDNESELTLGKIEINLKPKSEFVKRVIKSNQPQARWQIADLLGNVRIETNELILTKIINIDSDKYVIRRALLNLNKINQAKAIEVSKKYVNDSDEYLSIVANKIILKEIKH